MKIQRFRSALPILAVGWLAFLLGCSGSSHEMTTSNGSTSTMTGSVVIGTSPQSAIQTRSTGGLAGVTVRVGASGPSTQTDGAGNFTLTGVPAGNDQMSFDGSGVHAQGNVQVPGGSSMSVAVSIVGNKADIVPGGHPGEEIEGRVQTVNATTLTVADQRLGTVTIQTNGTTSIRHGSTTMTLGQILAGMQVHVKGILQSDGSYLATEILVQDLTSSP